MDDSLVDQFQLTLNIIVSLFVDRTIQLILKLNGFYLQLSQSLQS
jgi:hypothetical protein